MNILESFCRMVLLMYKCINCAIVVIVYVIELLLYYHTECEKVHHIFIEHWKQRHNFIIDDKRDDFSFHAPSVMESLIGAAIMEMTKTNVLFLSFPFCAFRLGTVDIFFIKFLLRQLYITILRPPNKQIWFHIDAIFFTNSP